MRKQSFIRVVLRPPAIAIAFLAKNLYKLVFGWWLDVRVARRLQRELADEIRSTLPYLFDEYAGKIVLDEAELSRMTFDYAIVAVELQNILLRFVRGRDDFRVDVAPKADPEDWQEVSLVLTATDSTKGFGPYLPYYRVADFGRWLHPQLAHLQAALSAENQAITKPKLSRFHEREDRRAREVEAMLNRKLR